MAQKLPYAGMPSGIRIRGPIVLTNDRGAGSVDDIPGTYKYHPLTTRVRIQMVGGGGAGGGVTGSATTTRAASGGASGAYQDFTRNVTQGGSFTYTIGAGGLGAASAVGGAGIDTSTTVEGVLRRANAGAGGAVNTGAGIATLNGGRGGSVSAQPGDIDMEGGGGGPAVIVANSGAANTGVSGAGGSNPLGIGGFPLVASGAGNNGNGYGSGGSGALQLATANSAGGNGAPGAIIVEEFS